jgi:hypothetical protein
MLYWLSCFVISSSQLCPHLIGFTSLMLINAYGLATDSTVLFIPEVGCVELGRLERSPESILLAHN